MNNREFSYIAGFIDGDGCICLSSKGPQISIIQSEKKKDILEYIKNITQKGTISLKEKKKAEFNEDMYQWYCCASDAIELTNKLLPYIIEKQNRFNIVSKWICGNSQKNTIKVSIKNNSDEENILTEIYSSQGETFRKIGIKEYIIRKLIINKKWYEYNNKLYYFEKIDNNDLIKNNHTEILQKYNEIKNLLPISDFDNRITPIKIEELSEIVCNIDINYICGFSEAEGCFCLEKNGNKQQFRCEISQKNIHILLQIMKFFNFGTIYYNKSGKGSYGWVVKNEEAKTYLLSIQPYIISESVKMQVKLLLDGTTKEELSELKGCSLKKSENPRTEKKESTRKPIKEGELLCSECGYSNAKNRWDFNRHMKTHQPPSIECELCEFKCRRKEHLTKHIQNIHSN
jgi:hypothetical protein